MTQEPHQGVQRAVALGFAWLLIVAGPALGIWGVLFLIEAHESASWPSVQGAIERVSTTRRLDDGTYHLRVTYRYVVDGTTHYGQRHSLGEGVSVGGAYDSEEDALQAGEERFPRESPIVIYYDPDAPDNALMTPGARWPTYVPLGLSLLLVVTGALVLKGTRVQRDVARVEYKDPELG